MDFDSEHVIMRWMKIKNLHCIMTNLIRVIHPFIHSSIKIYCYPFFSHCKDIQPYPGMDRIWKWLNVQLIRNPDIRYPAKYLAGYQNLFIQNFNKKKSREFVRWSKDPDKISRTFQTRAITECFFYGWTISSLSLL